ncbi:MAG: ABC transporter ATP-binding protein, partial [Clostridiales bacterium]|nr:ABC transporter ATP-binding protein [Clostridiales bacterium]
GRDLRAVLAALLCYLAAIAAGVALGCGKDLCAASLGAAAGRDMKTSLAGALLAAEYGPLARLGAGDALSTLSSDTQNVCAFLSGDLVGLFSQAAMALGALIYLVAADPPLALATFAYTPLGMCFTLSLNARMNRLHPLVADGEGRALTLVEQILSQIPVVKSFAMEDAMRRKVRAQYSAVQDAKMRIALPNALLQSACSSTAMIPRILFLIFAGRRVVAGGMTIGALVAAYDLLNFVIGPSVYFPFLLNGLNRAAASAGRIARLMALPRSAPTGPEDGDAAPALSIENLHFGYGGGEIIAGLNFEHSGCGVVAITGPSGAGKTTLLDLLAGLYRPTAGRVRLVGAASAAPQETTLFPATLMENVRLARPGASDAQVMAACATAGVDGFARALPQGYRTPLGDGAADLSGGQRQRLSLARLLLADKPVWLMDEPTSALDEETEKYVLDAIRAAAGRKLIVISAHRAALVALADRRIAL